MLGPRRWAFLGSITAALVLLGLVTQNGGSLALALPLVIYLAVGLFYQPRSPRLQVQRTIGALRAPAAQPVDVGLKITNVGAAPIDELEIVDRIPATIAVTEGRPRSLLSLNPGEAAQLSYTVTATRGLCQFDAVDLRLGDHLGLSQVTLQIPCPGRIFWLPRFGRLKSIEIRPRRTRVYAGTVRVRLGGSGTDFFGIREYYPGDPLRWLNWKATARRDRFITNEFEQERVADICLVLDARARSDVLVRGQSLFEQGVYAAASLADHFVRQGNNVGLLIYGRLIEWTYPGYGRQQWERLMTALASAQKGDKAVFEDLENIPTRLFPVGSQLCLISPLLDDDAEVLSALRARDYHVLVVSPDPVSFEARGLPRSPSVDLATRFARLEREVLLTRLRHAGSRVVDWDVASPLRLAVERDLRRLSVSAAQRIVI